MISSTTIPFCQSPSSMRLGTDEPQSPMPGVQIQMLANEGLFVSVMSPDGGDCGTPTGGCDGIGWEHVLPLRPNTNCKSWMSITPLGTGRLTSYSGKYVRLPRAARNRLATCCRSSIFTVQSPVTSPSSRRIVNCACDGGIAAAAAACPGLAAAPVGPTANHVAVPHATNARADIMATARNRLIGSSRFHQLRLP